MTKTSQAMANQGFNKSDADGNIEFLLSNANAAVSQALRQPSSSQAFSLQNEVGGVGNDSDSPFNYVNTRRVETPVINLPPSTIPTLRMVTLCALQEWEGYVVDITEDTFVARLIDLTAGKKYESEEAIIPMEELSETDAATMKVGSIFRWVIGYERSPEGIHKRVSQIVFRDLPRMTKHDLKAGREWASKIEPTLNP